MKLLALGLAAGYLPAAEMLQMAAVRPAMRTTRQAQQPLMALDPAAFSWLADGAIFLPDADTSAAAASAASAAAAVAEEPSWFDIVLVKPFETAITALHDFMRSLGIKEAYGPSIILFTVALKLATYPLTKQQIESTTKMQAIAPAAKALQEKYRNKDPARLNAELQALYTDNQVNPLAGCLPAIAQIPIFIGLYRSLLNLAKEDKLEESFLFLPSLEGPVADYQEGIGWLTEWVDGAPKFGWHDTACYLALPILLVISQYISTQLLTPKQDTTDPNAAQSQAILKFLPLMIGWFSLNVPSGLGLYWITNNVVTTLTTVLIRRSVQMPELGMANGVPAAPAEPPKPQGFGGVVRQYGELIEQEGEGGSKITITPPTAKGKRAERRAAAKEASAGGVIDATVLSEANAPTAVADALDGGVSPAKKKKKGGKGKKKK